MRVDLQDVGSWWRLNDLYREALAQAHPALTDPALIVQVFRGLAHGLKEISLSLSELLAVKKTVVLVADDEPFFEGLAVFLSGRGFQVRSLSRDEFNRPQEWYNAVASDLLFVMYAKDHPVTGEVYDLRGAFDGLKAARTHRIAISHFAHRFTTLSRPEPFEINLFSLVNDRTVMVAGERGKIRPLMAEQLPWENDDPAEISTRLATSEIKAQEVLRAEIENFEAALPQGFQAVFARGAKRSLDRTVFYHTGFDGSAIIELLSKKMSVTLEAPGKEGTLETTSLCRWGNPRQTEWFARQGLAPEKSRGLVVVDSSLIARGLGAELVKVAAELNELQSGTQS